MTKKEKLHVTRLRNQGKKLAKVNQICAGKPNDKGQFYKCLAKESKKVFK